MSDDRIGAVYADRDSRMEGRRVIVLDWDESRGKYRTQNLYNFKAGQKRGYTYVSAEGLDKRFTKESK